MILGVPFALYPTYASPHELVHCIRLSKATKIFAHASLYPKALDAAHIVGIPNTEVVILEGGTKIGVLDLPGVIKKAKIPAKEEFKPREVKKDDLAYLVFSSGTSGLPKGSSSFLSLWGFFELTRRDGRMNSRDDFVWEYNNCNRSDYTTFRGIS
jgi:long-subunit acyl-CoA synthetase (AMP-forming)